jgi:hypothetical protein
MGAELRQCDPGSLGRVANLRTIKKTWSSKSSLGKEGSKMHSEDVRINPAEAKARVDSGEAIILDVVAPQVWQQMQRAIVGAIRIDPREIKHRYHELPLNRQIIAYCT